MKSILSLGNFLRTTNELNKKIFVLAESERDALVSMAN